MTAFLLGRRVLLLHDVDRYPHFIAAAGSRGTVVYSDAELLRVKLDELLPGAEEWDNEILWSLRDGDQPELDIRLVGDPYVQVDALRALSDEELARVIAEGGPAALMEAAEDEVDRRGAELTRRPLPLMDANSENPLEASIARLRGEEREAAEQERAYERASADVLLPLSFAEAQAIADALGYLAGVDEGEHTDYEELLRLERLVRTHQEEANRA